MQNGDIGNMLGNMRSNCNMRRNRDMHRNRKMRSDRIMPTAKKRVDILSSFLVYRSVIVVAFLASLLVNWLGLGILAILLFSMSVLGAVSRLWGLFSLHSIQIRLAPGNSTMTVGDDATITYTVTNDKLLPVMWLELCQNVPNNDCLSPDSGFSKYDVSQENENSEGIAQVYRRRMVFVWSYQSLSWDTVWSANRRGLYSIDHITARSGDGFGLTQGSQSFPTGGCLIIVWPKIVPVATAPFFRNVWQGPTARRGFVEDPTVLQGLRDYLPGDSWKRIDWRIAARQDEIQVRKFETMLPGTVHFILDVRSFLGISEKNDELEESISVLASLILELGNLGIRCGISLPRGAGIPAVDMGPDDPESDSRDLLNALSALDADRATGGFDELAIESISQTVGQVWLLAYSGERLTFKSLVDKLELTGFSVLCYDSCAPGIIAGRPTLNLGELTIDS